MKSFFQNKNLKYIFHILNFVVFIFICYWVTKEINLNEIYLTLLKIPFNVIFIVFILNISLIPLYGERLKILIKCDRLTSNCVVLLGFGLSHVMPFKINEGTGKLTYSKKFYGIAIHKLISVFIIEKTYDFSSFINYYIC